MQSTLVIAPNLPTDPQAAQSALTEILTINQIPPEKWWWQFYGLEEKLTLDLVRELSKRALQTGGETGTIFVLANFTQASTTVQNALLKLLEEPPAAVWLILVATTTSGVLPTIQSRCRLCAALKPKEATRTSELLPILLTAQNKSGSQLAHELLTIVKKKVSESKKLTIALTETQITDQLLQDAIIALTDQLPQLQQPNEFTRYRELIAAANAALTRLRANVSAKNSLFYLAFTATMI